MFDVRIVSLADVTLNVAEGPRSGPPLLALRGGSSRWQAYRALLEPLVPRWHVHAPDLPEQADRAVQLLQTARVVRIPGCTHGLVWEEPEAVRPAIENFLESGPG